MKKDDFKILSDSEVKRFNKGLKDLYGISVTGQPIYRLVWSEDQFEVRKGDFNYYSEQGLYLGTNFGEIDRVRKYDYFKNRYVLEIFVPELQSMVAHATKELIASDGYEPLFVFHKKDQSYLEPAWWAIEYLVKRHRETIEMMGREKRTEEMDKREEAESIDKEAAIFMDYLESESSDLMNKFRYQEAVLIHKDGN